MTPLALAIGPVQLRFVASSFERMPTPFVRSTKILLRFSNLSMSSSVLGIDERTALPTKQQVYNTIEGTISHFELVMWNRGFVVPHEESYFAIESPNGELGFYLAGDGTDVAYRARCRPPSFIHFSVFPQLIRGHTLSDVVAVLGSLNIIAAELDR